MSMTIKPYGDDAILMSMNLDSYNDAVCRGVQSMAVSLRQAGTWDDVVSGYDSILVTFNPTKHTTNAAQELMASQLKAANQSPAVTGKTVEIPVYYGGEDGPDMGVICKSSGLSQDEVIRLHNERDYLVCMMGFIPGFTFLSEANPLLHHPRHDVPRASVAAGSVGIAGWQTGIYGLESPGGWQIIGRTPLMIFDKSRDVPFLLEAGDTVKFVPSETGGA